MGSRIDTLPCFTKTISRIAVTRDYPSSLPFPKEFSDQHRGRLDSEVLLKINASKKWVVRIGPVKNNAYAFRGSGWTSFVSDNDLAIGDEVMFTMLSKKLFSVKITRFGSSDADVPVKVKQEPQEVESVSAGPVFSKEKSGVETDARPEAAEDRSAKRRAADDETANLVGDRDAGDDRPHKVPRLESDNEPSKVPRADSDGVPIKAPGFESEAVPIEVPPPESEEATTTPMVTGDEAPQAEDEVPRDEAPQPRAEVPQAEVPQADVPDAELPEAEGEVPRVEQENTSFSVPPDFNREKDGEAVATPAVLQAGVPRVDIEDIATPAPPVANAARKPALGSAQEPFEIDISGAGAADAGIHMILKTDTKKFKVFISVATIEAAAEASPPAVAPDATADNLTPDPQHTTATTPNAVNPANAATASLKTVTPADATATEDGISPVDATTNPNTVKTVTPSNATATANDISPLDATTTPNTVTPKNATTTPTPTPDKEIPEPIAIVNPAAPRVTVSIKPTNLSPYYRLPIEKAFAVKWLPRGTCKVTLIDEAGQEWEVKWIVSQKRVLSQGWGVIAKRYNMSVGDRCTFEVLDAWTLRFFVTDQAGVKKTIGSK